MANRYSSLFAAIVGLSGGAVGAQEACGPLTKLELEQAQTALMAAALKALMNDPRLGLTAEQRAAYPAVVRGVLELVVGGAGAAS